MIQFLTLEQIYDETHTQRNIEVDINPASLFLLFRFNGSEKIELVRAHCKLAVSRALASNKQRRRVGYRYEIACCKNPWVLKKCEP